MTRSSDLERERLSGLTEANLRINESLGFDTGSPSSGSRRTGTWRCAGC